MPERGRKCPMCRVHLTESDLSRYAVTFPGAFGRIRQARVCTACLAELRTKVPRYTLHHWGHRPS